MFKKVTNFIISFVITTLILLVYFYLVHGLPVAQELEKTNTVSVQIMQENKTITLTNDEDIEKAVNVVKVLSFHFGEANDGHADTMCTFYQRDGSKIEIGANNDTIFKNDRQYVGVNESCQFFENLVQGLFFSETPQGGKLCN